MKIRRFAGALAVAALASTAFVAPAHAEPSVSGSYRTYAAVGSDTIQDVWNGLSNDGVIPQVANYNAFGSGKIQTRARGPQFKRPSGSGNGIKALSAAEDLNHTGGWDGVQIADQVDFARSSDKSDSAKYPGQQLTFIPFARDAVSVAVRNGGESIDLTHAQITALYKSCVQPIAGVTLKPLLPQDGSGTRKFFLKALDGTEKYDSTCVKVAGAENDGTQLTEDNQVIPFSAAQWISQQNGVVPNTLTDQLTIASIDSQSATQGEAPNMKPGALFGDMKDDAYGPLTAKNAFARDTYNVIATRRMAELEPLMMKAASSPIVTKYGFGRLSYVGVKSQYQTQGYRHK